jgi:acetyltransferase
VRGFLQVVEYRRSQELLMETPPSVPVEFTPDVEEARSIVQEVLDNGREVLTEPEAKAVMANYGIPVVETRVATAPDEAGRVAEELGLPFLAEFEQHPSIRGRIAEGYQVITF